MKFISSATVASSASGAGANHGGLVATMVGMFFARSFMAVFNEIPIPRFSEVFDSRIAVRLTGRF